MLAKRMHMHMHSSFLFSKHFCFQHLVNKTDGEQHNGTAPCMSDFIMQVCQYIDKNHQEHRGCDIECQLENHKKDMDHFVFEIRTTNSRYSTGTLIDENFNFSRIHEKSIQAKINQTCAPQCFYNMQDMQDIRTCQ